MHELPYPKLLGDCAVGDVITGINDRKVTKAADLAIALDSFQVGETITLKVRRGDEGSQVLSSLFAWQYEKLLGSVLVAAYRPRCK